MRVVVIGNGGREHALRTVLGRTAEIVGTTEDVDADLYVIGPEAPLVDGLADRLRADGKVVLGPGVDGAQMEASKAWMKDFFAEFSIPAARSATFTEVDPAIEYLKTLPGLYVVKTSGLAEGKGVLVTESLTDAAEDVRAKLSGAAFGDSGRTVVIEEGLTGEELSLFCVCDGKTAVAMQPAQDFKRIFDDGLGPNTGGMGAYSPVAFAPPTDDLVRDIVQPTLDGLRARGIDYRGVLYAGLMLTPDGPKLFEYNVRFGDPETQVVVPRYAGDLAQLLFEAASGELRSAPSFVDDAAVTVVLASGGYPTKPYDTGHVIHGIETAEQVPGVTVFEAGVGRDADGRRTVAGGRVLNVTALGPTIADARARAYEAVAHIEWPGMHYRTDIAKAAAAAG